jgi:uncharacterized membrane protein YecN with MAPEG domain
MPITALLTGVFALTVCVLSVAVSLKRRELMVAYGDGGDRVLGARIRAHGNFIEYAPLALIALAMIEVTDGPPRLVWALAAAFLVARALHIVGMLMLYRTPWTRAAAMLLQHAAFAFAGIWLLTHWKP